MAFSAFTVSACQTGGDNGGDHEQNQPGNPEPPENPDGSEIPEVKNHTVTFDSDGGSNVENKTVKEGEKVAKPADPTREHYDFVGWYLGETPYDFESAVKGNLTLKAKWKLHEYVVTFMADDIVFDKQYVAYGERAHTVETDPAKPGYVFKDWVTENEVVYDFAAAIAADTTLTAKWTPKTYSSYEVTFNSNGGSEVAPQSVTANGTAEEPTAPTKENFTFAGWYSDTLLTTPFDFGTKIKKATNLYAKWTLNADVEAVAVDTTYSFNSGDTNTSENYYVLTGADSVQGTSKEFHGITLDATEGKISDNGGQWFQYNKGAKISFYVKAGAKVQIDTYQNALTYTVNGVEANGSIYEFNADEKVTITSAADNMYIGKIIVTYPEAAEFVTEDTVWSFNSSDNTVQDNYHVFSGNINSDSMPADTYKLTFAGSLRDNGGSWYEVTANTTISFDVSKGCTVKITTYQNHTDYTINGNPANSTHTYTFNRAQTITYKATAQNYIGKIEVTLDKGGDTTEIPDGYELVTTTCDFKGLASVYGDGKPLTQKVVAGKFEFDAGKCYFESNKNDINTQGVNFYITLTGEGTSNSISFKMDPTASSSFTTLQVLGPDGNAVFTWTKGVDTNTDVALKGLEAGKYTVTTNKACRISNLKTTELLEQGLPASMTVRPATVDFLLGRPFTSAGLSADVTYANTAVKTQSAVTVDSSSYNAEREGEYIIRVFYTELGETVTATYSVYVYAPGELKSYDYTTSGDKQETLRKVYKTGEQLSFKGLTITTNAHCGDKNKEFTLSAGDYDVAAPDMTTAGSKTVTITAKSNPSIKITYDIEVVAAPVVENNTVTVTVDPSKAVTSNNVHTLNDAVTYLATFDASVKKVINIADGEYKEKVYINIPNVTIIGSATNVPDADTDNGVVIWYDALAGLTDGTGKTYGTNGSATVTIGSGATNFVAKNITFKNYYNTNALYLESKSITNNTQAVALYVASGSASFYGCKMTGYHDTLYANKGYHYYKNCWIEGHTDFIFGSDAVPYFDKCTIYSIGAGAEETNGGYIVAYQNSTAEFGPIFNDCDFTSDENVKDGSIALGRSWGANFKMVVLNSRISGKYSKAPHTAGTGNGERYCAMSGNNPKPENMLEYGNTGDGAITESIANTCTYMTETQAAAYGKDKIPTLLKFTPVE